MRTFALLLLLAIIQLSPIIGMATTRTDNCIVCKTSVDNNARGDLFALDCRQNHHVHTECVARLARKNNPSATLSTNDQCLLCNRPSTLTMITGAPNAQEGAPQTHDNERTPDLLEQLQHSAGRLLGFFICGHEQPVQPTNNSRPRVRVKEKKD